MLAPPPQVADVGITHPVSSGVLGGTRMRVAQQSFGGRSDQERDQDRETLGTKKEKQCRVTALWEHQPRVLHPTIPSKANRKPADSALQKGMGFVRKNHLSSLVFKHVPSLKTCGFEALFISS